jgi:probable rRNA maturation factor
MTRVATMIEPETLTLVMDLQCASDSQRLPSEAQLKSWAAAALESQRPEAELSVRIVDQPESQQLNHQYRQKDKPTNVLSFPADLPEELNLPLLGDLVICAPVVEHEAIEQNKALDAHWAHMTVHGTLHLLGYDHIDDSDAQTMERLETRILTKLGFPAPYEADN